MKEDQPDEAPISDVDLDAIAARCAAATPGPWRSFIEGRDHLGGNDFIQSGGDDDRSPDFELLGATRADQDFIAEARQDIPRLLAEIRRLRGLNAGPDLARKRTDVMPDYS